MEPLIRWHPFIDGNKRTGLLAAQTYLEINGYFSLFPIHVVRFSVNIAKTHGQDQNTIDNLTNDIANWLEQYVAELRNIDKIKRILKSNNEELEQFNSLSKQDLEKGRKIIDIWLAIDIYPEYKKEFSEVLKFIKEMQDRNIQMLVKLIEQSKEKKDKI